MVEKSGAARSGDKGSGRPITGRHVLFGVLAGFAVILTANMAMVIAATGSFPGLVVKNSYVASQNFNARVAKIAALGWRAVVAYEPGVLTAEILTQSGSPAPAAKVTAVVGRPSDARSDQTLTLERDPTTGYFTAPLTLGDGQWRIVVTTESFDGESFDVEAKVLSK